MAPTKLETRQDAKETTHQLTESAAAMAARLLIMQGANISEEARKALEMKVEQGKASLIYGQDQLPKV